MGSNYLVNLPWYVRLEGGERFRVPLGILMRGSRDSVFFIKIPSNEVGNAITGLVRRGFRPTLLAFNKGEVQSLIMGVGDPWELHVRVFEGGRIEAEVEVSREYIQHLLNFRFNVVYEVYEAMRGFVSERRICIKPLGKCVDEVIENIGIELKPPQLLIPWKPMVAVAASLLLIQAVNAVASPLAHLIH